ncbi:MAG: hypothetical protein PVH39_02525 [Syntrophobacterales bacterium]
MLLLNSLSPQTTVAQFAELVIPDETARGGRDPESSQISKEATFFWIPARVRRRRTWPG